MAAPARARAGPRSRHRRRRQPAPARLPAPQPRRRTVQKITLQSKALFDFDKAVLRPEGMAALDAQWSKLPQTLGLLRVGASGRHRRCPAP